MKKMKLLAFCSLMIFASGTLNAQDEKITENKMLIKLYQGLRVADICDGMDMVGLKDIGLMDPGISPLWKDTEDFRHQFTGIAFTVRYVPILEIKCL